MAYTDEGTGEGKSKKEEMKKRIYATTEYE
jgi:hypothetical protein